MNSKQIRQTFLDFFKEKQHEVVSSAPMVVKDDPTLMFTNAGMNQFKDLFLGNSEIKYPRITNSQKCLRVSGKHNDLEEVGVDTYHHTMFEMLGNWSFGDYFKKDAIAWAWELLTDRFGIDKDKLYVTVFEGDKADKLDVDQDAIDLWKEHIAEDRIILCDKKDNFWEMGEVGPCGPCSEIHVDLRPADERAKTDGRTLVNEDHPQVIEIWNLVFMQFNRMASGDLVPLPNTHVDTGMGFERLAVALQGKTSNYDTDVFMPLINKIEELSGATYGKDETTDIAIRVISDHVRTIAFSIADGQLPSNTGAGYVIRRILRRAVRYGYQTLKLDEAFIYQLVDVLEAQMGEAFPELSAQKELIKRVTKEEESAFYRTLDNGLSKMQNICNTLISSNQKSIDGKSAFEMYDTFGFPLDLISLIAKENNLEVDINGFNSELTQQKERSRSATSMETGDWVELREDDKEEFIGYDYLECDVKIVKYREVTIKNESFVQLVFSKTPFYPEGGGQVGDSGVISNENESVEIIDTKKENNLIIHFAKELPKDSKSTFKAIVNKELRDESAKNHSATHLLHEALRTVLGTHVEQKGSLVNADQLRFDFSHFSKVSAEEIKQIESLVNQNIRKGIELTEKRNTPIEEAKSMGAMALFGEKYGDTVRVIKFDSSVELCGGIHVSRSSEIGQFKITSEGSVASGVRRIEAITSTKADEFVNRQLSELDKIRNTLKAVNNTFEVLNDVLSKYSEALKLIEKFQKEKAGNMSGDLINEAQEINGVKFIAKKVDLDNASVKDLAFKLKQEHDNLFLVLATESEGKATISIALSNDLVSSKDMHAGNIIREVAKEINGGGGGQPFFATAGGKNPAGIEKAFEKALSYLN